MQQLELPLRFFVIFGSDSLVYNHLNYMFFVFVFVFVFFFFFQAEDGIRDIGVTGVQTCALPIYEAQRHHVELLKKLAIQKRTEDIPYFQDYEEIAQKLIFQPDRLEKMFALAMNPQDMFAMLKFEGAIEAFDDAYKESITTYTGRNILIDFFSCMWEHLPSNFFMGCYYYMVCYMSPLEGYKSHIYNYPNLVFVKTNLTEQQLVDQIKKEALGRFSPFGRDKKRAGIAIKKLMTSEGTIVERPMDSKQKVTVKISWNHTYYFT